MPYKKIRKDISKQKGLLNKSKRGDRKETSKNEKFRSKSRT